MSLFHPRVINKHIAHVPAITPQHAATLAKWSENLEKGIYDSETQNDGEFIQRILIDVLGYKGSSDGEHWTVAKNQPIGKGNVDVALGNFSPGKVEILAPLELKGARTRDLDALMPGRNKSPVKQAWEYAIDGKGTQWVLVSNYREIRLYAFGSGTKDYESFDLSKLTDPAEYSRFILLLSAENLLSGFTASLLLDSEKQEKEITDDLYRDYKSLRASMIRNIMSDNPEKDPVDIIRCTQTILDRVLFIAFAEDKMLLPEKTLERAFVAVNPYSPQPIWDNFKGLFRAIDKGNTGLKIPAYNGGLFKEDAEIDDLFISDELCAGFKKIGDYSFDTDVSVEILGHIFEQSISDLEELKAQADGTAADYDLKQGKRKKDGVFYTPSYVTQYMVERAVGGWLASKRSEIGFDELPELTDDDFSSIKITGKRVLKHQHNKNIAAHIATWTAYREILSNVKVLDPACGSGAFLNEVFDYLKAEGNIINNELARLTAGQTELFRWDTHILANNIYGVDLNPESVEITKLSLWLKTANRSEKLTYLDDNIKVGNSIISDEKLAGKSAFDWHREFSSIMEDGGFDVIVGNPPYVPMELIPNEQKAFFRSNYACLERKYDTSVVFILHSLKLLNAEGLLSFISSVTWQTGRNYISFRKSIIEEYSIEEIVNLPFDVFSDAYVDTCIYTIRNSDSSNNYKIYSYDKKAKLNHLSEMNFVTIGYDLVKMSADFAIILNLESNSIKQRILQEVPHSLLGDISISTQGLSKSRYELHATKFKDALEFVLDAEINRYKFKLSETAYTSMQGKESLSKFYGDGPKILIRRLISRQDRLLCAYTDKSYVLSKDTNPFVLNDESSTLYVLGILNSSLFSYLYVNSSSIATKDDFRQTTLTELRELPIADGSPAQRESVQSLVANRLALENKLQLIVDDFLHLLRSELAFEKLGKKLLTWYSLETVDFMRSVDKIPSTKVLTLGKKSEWIKYFDAEKSKAMETIALINGVETEIDEAVNEIYGLNDEERRLVNGR